MKLKTDITNVRVARSLWCIGAASLMVAGNAGAALLTGLVNGDFSTNDGTHYDHTADGWIEHEYADNGVGIFPNAAGVFEGASSNAVGSVIFNNDASDEPDAYMFQSLGTVDASDVGKTFTLSAGVAAWDWLDRVTGDDGEPYGDGDPSHSARFTIAFRSGVKGGDLLGVSDSTTVGIVNGNGVQGDVEGETTGLMSISATFTPANEDIGKEVFAVILADQNDYAASGQNRYVVDNVVLTPEPSSLALAALGVVLLAFFRRRR